MNTNLAEISQQRNSDINLLCPYLLPPLDLALSELSRQGVNIQVFEGFRSSERQRVLYEQGRLATGKVVTNARPWLSFHQYGLAIDLVFKDEKGKWTWDGDYKSVALIMQEFGFEWLGESDQAHFQMRDKWSCGDAYEVTRKYGVQALWSAIFNKGKGK